MKHFSTIVIGLFLSGNMYAQSDSIYIKMIDAIIVSSIRNLKEQPQFYIDSSKLAREPFTVKFYVNTKTDKLEKVDFVLLNRDVKMYYYYYDNKLIKIVGLEKTSTITLNFCWYYNNGKLVHYWPGIHHGGNNNSEYFVQKSKEYLSYFNR